MKLKLNTLTNSCVIFNDAVRANGTTGESVIKRLRTLQKDGFTMSRKQGSRIRLHVKYLLKEHSNLEFWTITTCQHLNGIPDALATKILGQYLNLRAKQCVIGHYIWVAEKQGNGSIHFHIMVQIRNKYFIKNEVAYLNEKFPRTGTNVFNREPITSDSIAKYVTATAISNYVLKAEKEHFFARPSQISKKLIDEYKENAYKYERHLYSHDVIFDDVVRMLEESAKQTEYNEFYTCYKMPPALAKEIFYAISDFKKAKNEQVQINSNDG